MSNSPRAFRNWSRSGLVVLGATALTGASLLATSGAALADTSAQCNASGACTQTYTHVGDATEVYTVPNGVTSLNVEVDGASGGMATEGGGDAAGASIKATLAVTPGEKLVVGVGAAGGAVHNTSKKDVPVGGWGPFGMTGGNGNPASTWSRSGASGGGASAIALDDASNTPLVIAGGAGGDGGMAGDPSGDGSGGYGGTNPQAVSNGTVWLGNDGTTAGEGSWGGKGGKASSTGVPAGQRGLGATCGQGGNGGAGGGGLIGGVAGGGASGGLAAGGGGGAGESFVTSTATAVTVGQYEGGTFNFGQAPTDGQIVLSWTQAG